MNLRDQIGSEKSTVAETIIWQPQSVKIEEEKNILT